MPSVHLSLDIAPDALLAWYRGDARQVVATADDGRTVRFPAAALQRHVRADGVRGRFLLSFDDEHRFLALQRLA